MPTTLEPKRILILTKYRFIGDTLLAIPLIREVKSVWPNAKVTLLTGAPACELLQGCPFIDSIIEFDPYRAQDKGWGRFMEIAAKIKRKKFDLAFVCNRSFHSALLVFLAGVRERVGWEKFHGRDFMLTRKAPYGLDDPEQSSYVELLRQCGESPSSDISLELWLDDEELDAVQAKVPSNAKPLIAFQPGASHTEKQWSADKYAELADLLLAELPDAHFILLGGRNECAASQEVLSKLSRGTRSRTTDYVGDLKLRQTMALITKLDLFIGGDTAVRHCATAFDIPSVALFGPTSVKKWGNVHPPKHSALQAPSGLVSDIKVDDVLAASLSAISSSSEAKTAVIA